MFRFFLQLACFLGMTCFCSLFAENASSEESPDKTLLILSSKGGYGHAAAVSTLEKLLGTGYKVHVVHPIDEMLRSSGINLGEKIYDVMLKKRWVRSLNFLARRFAPKFFQGKHTKIEKLITEYIQEYKPNLVISVIPFINYPASEAARLEETPYLLITTDNDLKNWSYGLEKVKHPHFVVTIGSDLPSTRDVLIEKKISENSIRTIGLPLRPEFIHHKERSLLREAYCIPEGKSVVLIMMGGSGSENAYLFAECIGSQDLSTHLIVCTGKHEGLKTALQGITLHPSNSMTIMGFTDKIADLMTISDLLITKPGPGTLNEAIAMDLPVIVDNTEVSLFWERANTSMVKRFGIGEGVKDLKELQKAVTLYLQDKEIQNKIHTSFKALPRNAFHEKIKPLIEAMILDGSPLKQENLQAAGSI